jgi:BON domain
LPAPIRPNVRYGSEPRHPRHSGGAELLRSRRAPEQSEQALCSPAIHRGAGNPVTIATTYDESGGLSCVLCDLPESSFAAAYFRIGKSAIRDCLIGNGRAEASVMYGRILTLLAVLAIALFVPVTAFSQANAVDLTNIFVNGGIAVDRLLVYQIGDIVLIRGRTGDPAMAAEAGRFAVRSGYRRVANLIEIVPGIGDVGIEIVARRLLEMSRELEGCTFQIDSTGGILRLRGQVAHEMQKGFAIRLVGRIDGVREVQSALTLPAAEDVKGRS